MPSPKGLSIFFLLALMEVLAGFAVIVGTSLLDLAALSYSMFWLLLLAASAGLSVGLAIALLGPSEPWNRLAILGAGALVTAVPALLVSHGGIPFLVATFLLAVLYWRGLSISQSPPDLGEVQGRFGIGFAVLFLGILWVIARGVIYQRPIWFMLALIGIAYTVTAMIALVVSRLSTRREPGAGRAVMVAVTLQLGALLVIAIVALQLFSLDIAGSVGSALQPFFNALGATLFHFVLLLAGPFQWLVSFGRPHPKPPRSTPGLPAIPRGARPNLKHKPAVGDLWIVIVGIVAASVILAPVAYLIWVMLPHIPRYSRERGVKEQREPLATPGELWHIFLRWLVSLFSRTAESAGSAVRRTRRRLFGEYPADPIRRLYAQLLRRAAAAGLGRDPGATPAEYGIRLQQRWPDVSFDLATLTDAYILRRYGEVVADDREVQRLAHHWQRIRSVIRIPRIPLPAPSASADTPVPVDASHRLAALLRLLPAKVRPWFADADSGLTRMLIVLGVCLITPVFFYLIFLILLAIGSH